MIRELIERKPVLIYFILALLFPWAIYIPYAANETGFLHISIPIEIVVFAQYGPLLAALLLTGIAKGRIGIQSLLKQALKWRVDLRWYLFVLFITAIIGLAMTLVHLIIGDTVPAPPDFAVIFNRFAKVIDLPFLRSFATLGIMPAVLSFFLLAIMNGGVSEEFGWRGYALPQLIRRISPFKTSLIIGILWGLWHTDNIFWADVFKGSLFPFFILFGHVLETMAIAVLFTWVYMRTSGSLLLCILFHAAINSTFTFMSYWWPREPSFMMYAEFTLGFWIFAFLARFVFGREDFRVLSNKESLTSIP